MYHTVDTCLRFAKSFNCKAMETILRTLFHEMFQYFTLLTQYWVVQNGIISRNRITALSSILLYTYLQRSRLIFLLLQAAPITTRFHSSLPSKQNIDLTNKRHWWKLAKPTVLLQSLYFCHFICDHVHLLVRENSCFHWLNLTYEGQQIFAQTNLV